MLCYRPLGVMRRGRQGAGVAHVNKRVTRRVADGYEIHAIRTRRKVPDLLAEALNLLEEKHGKV